MPCLRRETRARKGDLVSSAARENSQPADRPNLTEAVWKFVIKFRDDQTAELLIVKTHPLLPDESRFSHNRSKITRPASGK